MALSDSLDAIGAVTELLQTQLQAVSKIGVEVGRPGAGGAQMGRRLNLFLYRVAFDPGLRNLPLDDGQQPPLWLVLHYLLTAYEDHESDTAKAHRVLGRGLSALQSMAVLHPAGSNLALAANPQALKITFDDADVELVSRLTQGGEERFRLSAAFQVRPVMVAPGVDDETTMPVRSGAGATGATGVSGATGSGGAGSFSNWGSSLASSVFATSRRGGPSVP